MHLAPYRFWYSTDNAGDSAHRAIGQLPDYSFTALNAPSQAAPRAVLRRKLTNCRFRSATRIRRPQPEPEPFRIPGAVTTEARSLSGAYVVSAARSDTPNGCLRNVGVAPTLER